MPIQSITDSQAWNEFLKATQVARTRNAALTATPAGGQSTALNKARSTTATPVAQPIARTYAPAEPIREKAMLGTRFDAYA